MPKRRVIQARHVFAHNLREARHAADISQEELGALAGLHRNYVSSVERGERNVTIDTMAKLATALKLPLSQLVEGVA